MVKKGRGVALGFFDGVHLGHQAVIDAVLDCSVPTVVTFSDAPKRYLLRQAPLMLTTAQSRRELLRQAGIKELVELDFEAVRDWSPEDFVNYLVTEWNASVVSCGYDFRFGKNGAGNAELLRELGKSRGMTVLVSPPVKVDGEVVSSTQIRRLLTQGETGAVARMLGRPFSFDFPVIHGDERGRTFGIPTINQRLPQGFILPRFGVYATRVRVGATWKRGLTNVGVRPTVGSPFPRSETYILDYHGDLYGETVAVELHHFVREERKFDSLEALERQIKQDEQSVREYWKDHPDGCSKKHHEKNRSSCSEVHPKS